MAHNELRIFPIPASSSSFHSRINEPPPECGSEIKTMHEELKNKFEKESRRSLQFNLVMLLEEGWDIELMPRMMTTMTKKKKVRKKMRRTRAYNFHTKSR